MGMSFTVGGTQGTFDEPFANEVASLLDNAFGAEGDWEGVPPLHFGELFGSGWTDLQSRAIETLGDDMVPNLLALGEEGRGVYLPTHVRAVSLPLSAGSTLRSPVCRASATSWPSWPGAGTCRSMTMALKALLRVECDPDDGSVADSPEILAFARLALAANEAVRRDCPLWVVG